MSDAGRDARLGALEPPGSYGLCWKDLPGGGKCDREKHDGSCGERTLTLDWRRANAEAARPLAAAQPWQVRYVLDRVDPAAKQDKNGDVAWPGDGGALRKHFEVLSDGQLAEAAVVYHALWVWRGVDEPYDREWRFVDYAVQVLRARLGLEQRGDVEVSWTGKLTARFDDPREVPGTVTVGPATQANLARVRACLAGGRPHKERLTALALDVVSALPEPLRWLFEPDRYMTVDEEARRWREREDDARERDRGFDVVAVGRVVASLRSALGPGMRATGVLGRTVDRVVDDVLRGARVSESFKAEVLRLANASAPKYLAAHVSDPATRSQVALLLSPLDDAARAEYADVAEGEVVALSRGACRG